MTKQPEEGKIWEWRAFGALNDTLRETVQAYPIRSGILDHHGEDIYLIAPHSDQNVKLRRNANRWILKLKLLVATRSRPFELYDESADFTYEFPMPLDILKEAARLLEVILPDIALSTEEFPEAEFVKALKNSTPAAADIWVSKTRSQYQFENGWVELADVSFAKRGTQSLSVHSRNLDVVKEMVERLQPGDEMKPMNYIEACRRWG